MYLNLYMMMLEPLEDAILGTAPEINAPAWGVLMPTTVAIALVDKSTTIITAPKAKINIRRILQTMVSGIPSYRPLEPEGEILMFYVVFRAPNHHWQTGFG